MTKDTPKNTPTIERLPSPVSDADFHDLARLLVDAVDSGAAVSFLAPLTPARADAWWRQTLSASHTSAIVLVARDTEGIVGTVQLHPAWAPNQPHRAEIAKLLVHRRGRRAQLGTRLMQAIEDAARGAGLTLLTLDTKRGDRAEHLYRQLGWTPAGTIPGFAFDPDGTTAHDAVLFYKHLHQGESSRVGSPQPHLPTRSPGQDNTRQHALGAVALVVREYDEAITFYPESTGKK